MDTTKKPVKIINKLYNDKEFSFQIQNCNVSIINAIRRTILSDIDTIVVRTTPYEKNDADFIINTTRTHNEMLKHRLSCIPIHIKDTSIDLEDFVIECNEKNDTDTIRIITTEHFKIKNINTDNYLSSSQVKEIFPPDDFTKDYIIFTKLRPKLTELSSGEQIYFKAKMSIGNASEDSTFNVVSTCSYSFSPDKIKQDSKWNIVKQTLKDKGLNDEDIISEKQNWYLSDAKRIVLDDTFDFIIKSIGVFDNTDIIKKACNIINNSLTSIKTSSISKSITIKDSDVVMKSFDVTLDNVDYTIGKIIEYALYDNYYGPDNIFSFVGFSKQHPHDKFSIIRLAFSDTTKTQTNIYPFIEKSCDYLINIFESINSQL